MKASSTIEGAFFMFKGKIALVYLYTKKTKSLRFTEGTCINFKGGRPGSNRRLLVPQTSALTS